MPSIDNVKDSNNIIKQQSTIKKWWKVSIKKEKKSVLLVDHMRVKKGWKNIAMNSGSTTKVQVIIDKGEGKYKAANVHQSSIAHEKKYINPQTNAQAILSQFPDLEQKLVTLCQQFVKAGIDCNEDGIAETFAEYMNAAGERQHLLGSKAVYCKVYLPFSKPKKNVNMKML